MCLLNSMFIADIVVCSRVGLNYIIIMMNIWIYQYIYCFPQPIDKPEKKQLYNTTANLCSLICVDRKHFQKDEYVTKLLPYIGLR